MSKNTIKNLVRVALEEAQVVINRRCGCKGNPDGVPTPACMTSVVKPGNCSTDSDCKGECVPRDGKMVKCPENEFCDPDLVLFKPEKRKSKTKSKRIKEQCFPNPTPPPTFGNYGCMDPTATNYDAFATHPCNSIGPNTACADCSGNVDYCGPGNPPGDCCEYPTPVPGCTDPNANNYDPNATVDDGSCTYSMTHLFTDCTGIIPGSAVGMSWVGLAGYDTNQPANNSQLFYNFLGSPNPGEVVKVNLVGPNNDLNLCIQYDGTTNQSVSVGPFGSPLTVLSTHTDCNDCQAIYGCTDQTAINYDSSATVDDGSCQYPVYGCTDQLANNYDPNATVDDGSCVYEEEPLDCSNQLDVGCWICKDPVNFPGCQQLGNVNQVTMAINYGLQGFNLQQDCIDSTQCGNNKPDMPCEKLEQYIMNSNYSWIEPNVTTPGPSNINVLHFCEKCNSGEINDPMCRCCKTDPCDKKQFVDALSNEFNMAPPEFCKYCKYGMIQNQLCKCCKRFEKVRPKRMKRREKLEEEINRIKKIL